MSATERALALEGAFVPPLSPDSYDRRRGFSEAEHAALERAERSASMRWPAEVRRGLARLVTPIEDVCLLVAPHDGKLRSGVRSTLVRAMHEDGQVFFDWDRERWVKVLEAMDSDLRHVGLVLAYLLCGQRDLHLEFRGVKRRLLVKGVFGTEVVEASRRRVDAHLNALGFGRTAADLYTALYETMLQSGSPYLEDLDLSAVSLANLSPTNHTFRYGLGQLARTLAGMGLAQPSHREPDTEEEWLARTAGARADVPVEWADSASRWCMTSVLARRGRQQCFYLLLKVGRWLAAHHPEATKPESWTRQLAVEWIAAVDRMAVGEFSHAPSTFRYASRLGAPLSARSKDAHIGTVRTFFSDLQEWEWIPRRFDPVRVLRTPRSVRALIGPDPRVLADDVWAKLIWAGLNLRADDLPKFGKPLVASSTEPWYPLEMVRAVALVWLFAGLRVNEIGRLRTGCVRFQPGAPGGQADVCLLAVPINKTGTAFTKPVDRSVGDAIEAWEAVRPVQPPFLDQKTGEFVEFLFANRGSRLSPKYVNRVLIPMLCGKAGVPRSDLRGPITSHRARATIATQLHNAKDPMSLFELQEWLGHHSPDSTQQYARITPTTLIKAYADAGYFARNVRAIEVLLDRDAIGNGAAANGQPYQYFDLGHGYCTFSFFEQCPHRMACARCDFYLPKDSTKVQLLEAKGNLSRMLAQIPLTDDERAAVEDGEEAVDRLLERLADVPTPSGPTPRALDNSTGPDTLPSTPRPQPVTFRPRRHRGS